jgi:prepilin-type N-terminal cleavage/methylation domain-containing protein
MKNSFANTSRGRGGFSFVEIMVAMTLLATVLGSLGVLSAKISQRARRASVLAQRNYIVVQQLNRYNALPYDSLKLYAMASTADTIPSALPTIRFVRRDTVYRVTSAPADTNRIEVKVVIVPLTSVKSDTMLKDAIILRRRNPRLTSPLNY